MQHDEVWNLVLAHGMCNESKSDKLVGEHYVAKLIARNENIMGSNHPWKRRIIEALGNANDHTKRASKLRYHYENVKKLGRNTGVVLVLTTQRLIRFTRG